MRFTSIIVVSFISLNSLATAGPVVTIHNTKTRTLCLKVEHSSGHFPTTTVCGGAPGINVARMETSSFYPSKDFNGAITPITNGVPGTRFEINFASPGGTWYDADMEMGISGGTLGPSDHRKRPNGLPSLAGEQDPLAKANAAWAHVSNKAAFAGKYPRYMGVSKDWKRLESVHMDKAAPQSVKVFFQLTARFNAYVVAGSVQGKGHTGMEKALAVAADEKSWFVNTQAMTITIF